MNGTIALDQYRLLGRSGLRVSPLALGTMTFGQDWGWGADESEAERILGKLMEGRRDRIVLSTKFTMPRTWRAWTRSAGPTRSSRSASSPAAWCSN